MSTIILFISCVVPSSYPVIGRNHISSRMYCASCLLFCSSLFWIAIAGETSDSEKMDLELRLGLPVHSQMISTNRGGSEVDVQQVTVDSAHDRTSANPSRKRVASAMDAGNVSDGDRNRIPRSAASRERNRIKMKRRRDGIKAKVREKFHRRKHISKLISFDQWS